MIVFLQLIVIIVLCQFSGCYFVHLLLPEQFWKYKNILAVTFGLGTAILLASYSAYLGFTFNQSSLFILLVLIGVNALTFILFSRYKKINFGFSKEELPIYLAALVSVIVLLIPFVYYKSIQLYGDSYTYLSISDYLLENSYMQRADPGQFYPYKLMMVVYQTRELRMGAQFFLSFITVLLQNQFSILNYFGVFGGGYFIYILSFYFLGKFGFKLNNKAALIACILLGLHSNLNFANVYYGFFPQFFGMIFFFLLIALFLRIDEIIHHKLFFILSVGFSGAVLVISYSEIIPFCVLICASIFTYKYRYNIRQMLRCLPEILYSGLAAILLGNLGILKAFHSIPAQLTSNDGYHIRFALWDYLMLIFSLNPTLALVNPHLNRPAIYLIFSLATLLLIYIFSKHFLFAPEDEFKRISFTILPIFLILLIYFIFLKRNPYLPNVMGQSWSVYKLIQYALPFIVIPLSKALCAFQLPRLDVIIKQQFNNVFLLSLITGYLCANSFFAFRFYRGIYNQQTQATGNSEDPIGEYFKLEKALQDEQRVIALDFPSSFHEHKVALTYFLRKHMLVSDWKNAGYLTNFPKPPQESYQNHIRLVYSPELASDEKIANMKLVKADENYLTNFTGFHSVEQNENNIWRWSSGKEAALDIYLGSDDGIYAVQFAVGTLSKSVEQLTIRLGDQVISTAEIHPAQVQKVALEVPLKEGLNTIQFAYSGEPGSPPNGDPRILGFSILNFEFIKAPQ